MIVNEFRRIKYCHAIIISPAQRLACSNHYDRKSLNNTYTIMKEPTCAVTHDI